MMKKQVTVLIYYSIYFSIVLVLKLFSFIAFISATLDYKEYKIIWWLILRAHQWNNKKYHKEKNKNTTVFFYKKLNIENLIAT